ncbi:MAG: ribbon-helix-helix domain-containing protein [Cyanobacteria bacterium CAN_BIN43]|nr:ribbon-helix-helix domain-containing protein [Cyanobacteria bacterium CAN_BIN43]
MQKLTVRFSDEEYNALTLLAERKERSLNEIVREAVREYLAANTRG